jgi:hypothetical protein
MSENPKRPILVRLTSHWISMLGVALVTIAGFSWLFVLPTQLQGHTNNPYTGIIAFIFIRVIFILGLVLTALGVFLARRRIERLQQELITGADRGPYIRKLAIFFALTSAVNIIYSTLDKKLTITQDCNTCHDPLTVEEASPGVLKTMGLEDRIASL